MNSATSSASIPTITNLALRFRTILFTASRNASSVTDSGRRKRYLGSGNKETEQERDRARYALPAYRMSRSISWYFIPAGVAVTALLRSTAKEPLGVTSSGGNAVVEVLVFGIRPVDAATACFRLADVELSSANLGGKPCSARKSLIICCPR